LIQLSPQQAKIVAQIRCGASYEEIARNLGVSRRTVTVYVDRIAKKLENPEGFRPYLLLFLWSRGLR
jgi:DNA-binding NarL/FixJ family response regulator